MTGNQASQRLVPVVMFVFYQVAFDVCVSLSVSDVYRLKSDNVQLLSQVLI